MGSNPYRRVVLDALTVKLESSCPARERLAQTFASFEEVGQQFRRLPARQKCSKLELEKSELVKELNQIKSTLEQTRLERQKSNEDFEAKLNKLVNAKATKILVASGSITVCLHCTSAPIVLQYSEDD